MAAKKGKPNLMLSWNKITSLLLQLKKAWDEHTELWAQTSKDEIQTYPVEYQRFLARNFNRSRFDIMLPRLVDYWRTIGGVEALRVKPNLDAILQSQKKKRKES